MMKQNGDDLLNTLGNFPRTTFENHFSTVCRWLNLGGALLWSVTIVAGGYLFGHLVEQMLGDLRFYEEILFAVLAVGGLAFWWFSRRRAGRSD